MGIFYYSYRQMRQELKFIQDNFPDLVRVRILGRTADNREILEAVTGEETAPYHILIHGGMHGREYLNCALLMRQLQEYLLREEVKLGKGTDEKETGEKGTGENEEGKKVKFCFHVVPMVNPDGCEISQFGPACVRNSKIRRKLQDILADMPKTEEFRHFKANAGGVDINRNFRAGWGKCGQETSDSMPVNPAPEGYLGTAPESEPETRAVLRIEREYPLSCCISYHSSGSLIYWDYGADGGLLRKEKRLAARISAVTGYPLHSTVADSTQGGGCSDYMMQERKIPAITIETGKGECPLMKEEFGKIYMENKDVWEEAKKFCRDDL